MTIPELLKLAQVRQKVSGQVQAEKGRRSLEGYCTLVAFSLREALAQQKVGRPAVYTGKETQEVLKGRGDRANDWVEGRGGKLEEEVDDYAPVPGDPTGWGIYVAETIIILAALCRRYSIPLDAILERRLRRYEEEGNE